MIIIKYDTTQKLNGINYFEKLRYLEERKKKKRKKNLIQGLYY